MFETLFSYRGVLCRHRTGPLATERAAYLTDRAAQGMARGTILRLASYCLCVAEELRRWPPDHRFDEQEVEALAAGWAAKRVADGHASSPRWPKVHFRFVALELLGRLGRLRSVDAVAGPYQRELADFLATRREGRWSSEATCRFARWQITRFLAYLGQRNLALGDVAASDIDAYFRHMGQRWSRSSLSAAAKTLRAWFAYCEKQGMTRSGLAAAILLPRLYRHERLPIGPTWEQVGRMLSDTSAEAPALARDHAILLLLAVYGLRSGEVRRLALDDIDWAQERVRIVRSKSGWEQTLPLDPRVGNAIARYLRLGRPKSDSRVVFLTLRAPPRPLSAGAVYDVVQRHLSKVSSASNGRGPHALRHACARHLLEVGWTFKDIGDHLGHRSPDATRLYAKVDLTSLRRVAFSDLGGLE